MCSMLYKLGDRISFKVPDGGMSIWLQFKGIDTMTVAKAAAQSGLFICDGKKHNTSKKDFNSICLGFASMNSSELEQALSILNRSVMKITKG